MAKEMDRAKTRLQSSFIAQPKSKIAKLVHLLPEIESSIAGGHTYQDCVGLLREYGLEFTLTSFATTLKRARKLSESDRARILGITDDAVQRGSGLTGAGGQSQSRRVGMRLPFLILNSMNQVQIMRKKANRRLPVRPSSLHVRLPCWSSVLRSLVGTSTQYQN